MNERYVDKNDNFTQTSSIISIDQKIKLLEISANIAASQPKNDLNKNSNYQNEFEKIFYKCLDLVLQEKKKENLKVLNYESTYSDDYIVCLEDGKKLKMLKRHLRTFYNMSLDEYKKKWNLPHEYPTVCKNYSILRQKIAKN